MGQINVSNAKGLKINSNSFSLVPDGSYEIATNVIVKSDGIVQKRRGLRLLADKALLASPSTIFSYVGNVFVAQGNTINLIGEDGSVSAPYGELLQNEIHPRTAPASGNVYISSDVGVRKLESISASLLQAGVPRGLDVQVSVGAARATEISVFEPNSQISFRVIFGRKDANNNLIVGAPSELAAVNNPILVPASVSGSGTTVTVNTAEPHGQVTDFRVAIEECNDADADGSYTATVTSTTQFTFVFANAAAVTTLKWGAYAKPTVVFSIPESLSTEYLYQVYRSDNSSAVTVNADESTLQLIAEANLTASDISTGSVSFVDSVPDSLKKAYLYTNPNTGEGILGANEEPPRCTDIAAFKNHLFYANTSLKYSTSINLVSTQPADMQNGDYFEVTLSGVTRRYTAGASEVLNTATGGTFALTSATSTTVASSIATTARSICKVINRDLNGVVYAYYVSSINDVPGQIKLIARLFGSVAFSITASATRINEAFTPFLGSAIITQDKRQNRVYFSKRNEPEAVPVLNFFDVGAKNSPILRIGSIADSLIVVKEDGIFRLNGEDSSSFVVTTLDPTVVCLAPNSLATLNNTILMCSNQGVVSISDTGVQVLSRSIENKLLAVIGKSYFSAETSASAYESERIYLLTTVSPFSSKADVVYIFNASTETWTTYSIPFRAGVVNKRDKLTLLTTDGDVLIERKENNKLDYCDRQFSASVISVADDKLSGTIELLNGAAIVGDVIVYAGVITRITAVSANLFEFQVTFLSPANFIVGDSITLYKAIPSKLRTSPIHGGDVSTMKQFSACQIFTKNPSISGVDISFASDQASISQVTRWTSGVTADGWGNKGWSLFPWGESEGINSKYLTEAAEIITTLLPVDVQRASYIQVIIEHDLAAESLEIQTVALTARPYGTIAG